LNRKRYFSLKRRLSSSESESENERAINLGAKLKFLNGSEPECTELWEESYDHRAKFITKKTTNLLNDIFATFPIFKQASASTFVSIFF